MRVKELLPVCFVIVVGTLPVFSQEYRSGGYIEIIESSACSRQLISLPTPVYPTLVGYGAHTYNGVVSIQLTVNKDGLVESAKGVAGHNFFRAELEKQVRQAKFTPALLQGEPVEFNCTISYRVSSSSSQTISCGVCNSKAVVLPKPEYPASASTVRVSGSVTVHILIDEQGNVEKANVVSGHPLLRAASVKAALQARFEPFLLSNKPVKVSGTLVYNFKRDWDQ